MITNPRKISWNNPTEGIDASGNTVAWNASTDLAGIEIELDGTPEVSVPVSLGANNFDLTTLASYKALAVGQHTIAMAVVTKEGAVSPFTSAVTFLSAVVPLVPTNIVVA
jgi:hypothetical protein